MDEYKFFSCSCDGIADTLITNVYVFSKYQFQELTSQIAVQAIWDTGATKTAISTNIVKRLKLISKKSKLFYTPQGSFETKLYNIDIMLPKNILIQDLEVVEMLNSRCDVLIRMDIISQGDFAISNFEGQTKFSYRIPSQDHVRFLEEYLDSQN